MQDLINIFINKITSIKSNLKLDAIYYQFWMNNNYDRYIFTKDNTYHMIFIKNNGLTIKWGRTLEEDALYNPIGPEIADIELTKICKGIHDKFGIRKPCPWCYKNNNRQGDYMSFEKFKYIFKLLNQLKTLTQIAFGTDASLDIDSNPDYWKILDYCNINHVTPNITIADIDDYNKIDLLIRKCGAIAVSYYAQIDKNRCYDTINRLIIRSHFWNKDIKVNIHAFLSKETLSDIYELINDYKTDKRLRGVNAIVFLSLKQKGRGINFNQISQDEFKDIINTCFKNNIPFGMDSCSANKFVNTIKDMPNKKELEDFIEPCEATLHSSYIDCYGNYYPCSFMEKEGEWKEGINLLKCTDFSKDVWYNNKVVNWRNSAINRINTNKCNYCPYFKI